MTRAGESRSAFALPIAQPLEDEHGQLRVRLKWLLVFRAALVTALLVTSILLQFRATESLLAPAAIALYAVAILSYLSVLVGGLWMRRFRSWGLGKLAYGQLMFDALVSTFLVILTGGIESVFIFVYSLTVLNAAAVLQRRGALVLAAVVAALYSCVLAAETSGVIPFVGADVAHPIEQLLLPFLTNTASFILVAILAGVLAEQLKHTSEKLHVARRQLERIEELYRAVLESLPSGVLTVDAVGRIVYVNGAGADILGTTAADLVGRLLGERAPVLAASAELEVRTHFEIAFTIEARERMIGGSVARLTGLEGMAGRVLAFEDLTELRRLQNDAARAERLAELGRFAAGLAHEIRNPLAAMIGCLQLLRSDAAAAQSERAEGGGLVHESFTAGNAVSVPAGADAERMLGIVHREAERLSGLVTGFLTYARPSPSRIEPISILSLAQETVSTMRSGMSATIDIDVVGEESVALCDATQLRQALWNVVGNAMQAVGEAGADGRERALGHVRVSVGGQAASVIISVDDNGPGVPEHIRSRIFEPFFTTRADGTGLGLATVQQTLAQMKGSITLEASSLGGACFVVRLPRVPSSS